MIPWCCTFPHAARPIMQDSRPDSKELVIFFAGVAGPQYFLRTWWRGDAARPKPRKYYVKAAQRWKKFKVDKQRGKG